MSLQLFSILFLLLCGVMAAVVVGLLFLYLSGRTRTLAIAVFAAWLGYAGVLGYAGIIASKAPPGLAFLLVPALLFIAGFLVRNPGVRKFSSRIPVEWLLGLQGFRVFVEIALFKLFQLHMVPRLMTFEGGNLDIFTGVSAPIVAWLYATKRIDDRTVRAWSWVGLALLGNAVMRAVLTATGLVHAEFPNSAVGLFPFTFLPGLLVPLALSLHALLLRSVPRQLKD